MTEIDTLSDLLRFREKTLYNKFISDMVAMTKQGKTTYQIMMREISDTIQDLALAYGERNTIEACAVFIEKLKNQENKRVMSILVKVFSYLSS